MKETIFFSSATFNLFLGMGFCLSRDKEELKEERTFREAQIVA
jgi:hypothetical protein